MSVGRGMAYAWMRAIREGYLAKQKMAHLSNSRWKYLRRRLHERNQKGSGLPLLLGFGLANVVKNFVKKRLQKGSGQRRKRRRITRRP